jgi:class 3 adenylate cyclase
MLFVNRIAHILHSIVVQCSGAANKNIGDAFLLTWKIDEKATKEQKALLADQALLTFCKALIELSRHQEFICNFSVAATARLLKRFPDYKVRIGSGLHVGWAIEGAIGSNRKIDASYLSPHVSGTEFLESSTKAYGVSLLISEPFFKLLSPAAAKYCRQVDRIRKSEGEEPMGLYTYDSDLSIDWNDPFRHRKKSDARSRFRAAAQRVSTMGAAGLNTINENSGNHSTTTSQSNVVDARRNSRDVNVIAPGGRRASALGAQAAGFVPVPVQEIDEADPETAENAAALEAMEKRKQTPTMTVPKYYEKIWVQDQDLIDLRHKVNDSFRVVWDEGIAAYIAGDWTRAKEKFEETNRMGKGKDGPSKNLLDYMAEHGDAAPSWWKGYREEEGGGH